MPSIDHPPATTNSLEEMSFENSLDSEFQKANAKMNRIDQIEQKLSKEIPTQNKEQENYLNHENERETATEASIQKAEQAQKTLETSNILNTRDLPPLTEEQAKMIIQVLDENPDITIENNVTHEVATTLSFETINTKELSEIAVKMRHHNSHDEMFDLRQSTNPKEKFFFASLSALVNAYNGSEKNLPIRGFKNLSGEEMSVLHEQFILLMSEKYPHLNLNTNYKITELMSVAGDFLSAINFIRDREDTDLFSNTSLVNGSTNKNAKETKDDFFTVYDDFQNGRIE